MANNRAQQPDDLQANENLKRVDALEEFRKQLEGKEFDKKSIDIDLGVAPDSS
jgi:hypothetical protein